MDLFIYYKVRTEYAIPLQLEASSMQSALASKFNIAPALKCRLDPKDGYHTWMEIYPDIPIDFESHLAGALSKTNLSNLIEGSRHVEYFLNA
jgi:hypothetical protein